MKRIISLVLTAVVIMSMAVMLGACGEVSGRELKRDGITFTMENSSVLSDIDDDDFYNLMLGNMITYDRLLLDGEEYKFELFDESEDYQALTKVCFSASNFKSSADVLKSVEHSYLYLGGEVYEPYYIMSNFTDDVNRTILLFDSDLDISSYPVFSLINPDGIVICEEDEAKNAATADLNSANENTRSEAYDFYDTDASAGYSFEAGNTCYKDGDYDYAECRYLVALNKSDDLDDLSDYTENDVRNNLVLTRLQLEKNEYALRMASELVENNPVSDASTTDDKKDSYGYIINLLVAAHANKLTAEKAFSDCSSVSLSDIEKDLTKLADDDPGEFVRFMTALVYNEQYMAMEETEDKAELKKITDTLDKLNKQEKKTFDAYDEDISELKEYLSAKIWELDNTATEDSKTAAAQSAETTKATE